MITIHECALLCIPRGQVKRFKPFWNNKLQGLKKERDHARQQAFSTGSRDDCIQLRKKHATLKKEILSSKRASYSTFLEKLDFRRDGLKAHQFLSRLNNQTEKRNQPIITGGKTLTSDFDIAEGFNKHYCKVSNFHPVTRLTRKDLLSPPTCLTQSMDNIFNSPITFIELQAAIKRLIKGKSAGPDEMLPEFLIYLGDRAKNALLYFLNKTWGGHLPSIWRKADVIPVLKHGKNPKDMDSFRPISITCILSKLVERIVVDRLQNFLEGNKCISERQAGFRRNRGTVEQITRLAQQVKDGFHAKQSTLAVFVDFKSAFDRIWRKLLLRKLARLGVSGCLFGWIRSFLSQRFTRVKYGNAKSRFRQTRQGLPQGSVLSPYLFNIFINDVIEKVMSSIPGVQVLLYADDLVMWATGSDVKALEYSINKALDVLADWAKRNEMVVNGEKTAFQLFTLSTKSHTIVLRYEGRPLLQTENAIYLGLVLDTKLNWNKQVNRMTEMTRKRMNLLRRLSGIRWGASQEVLTTTYKSYVRPLLDYGCELLVTASGNTLSRLDVTQNQALRLITGAARSTPIESMELQVGIEPLADRRERAALVLREKFLRREDCFWSSYRSARCRLKTQHAFLTKVNDIGIRLDMPDVDRQPFLIDDPLRQIGTAVANFDLILPCNKKTCSDVELKSLALATINERYPPQEWLHIYTDGSADAATKNAGAGAFCKFFQLNKPVGAFCDNFDGEISAVLLAAQAVISRPEGKIVFLIDSQAAIRSLVDPKTSLSTTEADCKRTIDLLINMGKYIMFQWIPSHCGVLGNERADNLAKAASLLPQPNPPLPMRNCRALIHSRFKKLRHTQYVESVTGKKWQRLLHKDGRIPTGLPRRVGVACFRTLTGHDFLQAHLHRIGIAPNATCPLCGFGTMDGDHLTSCPELLDIRSGGLDPSDISDLYWTARHRMAERPTVGAG